MDDIYKLTPIDHAVATIDMTIAELRRRRNELEAQLPERPGPRRVVIRDPRVMRGESEAGVGGLISLLYLGAHAKLKSALGLQGAKCSASRRSAKS